VSHASGWLLVLKKVNAVDRFPERDSNWKECVDHKYQDNGGQW
jgi:hypothetical protein